jgi:thiol-disulfide isomerase/thioredoxin
MTRRLRIAVAVLAALTLAGCSAAADVPPEIPASATAPATLAALKQAANIKDCPVSDADVPALPDGLPDMVVGCLGGGRQVRLAGLRGMPMLINVWGQWCAPCREEAPYLTEIAGERPKDLMILGIDYDDPRPDYAIEFAQISRWTFPQLADPERTLAGPLKVSGGPPQTLFVAADGRIVYRHAGPFESAAQIRTAVREHLGVGLG